MSADLHIHVLEGISENTVQRFQGNSTGPKWMQANKAVARTPNVWIGEVSWLKAALTEESENYVPDTVARVYEVIGEDFPVLDDALIAKIIAAFDLKNTTGYSLAEVEGLREFLEHHRGKRVFTVSW